MSQKSEGSPPSEMLKNGSCSLAIGWKHTERVYSRRTLSWKRQDVNTVLGRHLLFCDIGWASHKKVNFLMCSLML